MGNTVYTTRVSVGVIDLLLRKDISDHKVVLYSENGSVAQSWNSSGTEYIIKGLNPGNYYIVVDGKESSKTNIVIGDDSELQRESIYIWTSKDTIAAIIAGLLLGIVILLIYLLNRNKREK